MKSGDGLDGFAWPEGTQDFQMRIARDGTWWHRGGQIKRQKLVQLFATVLQRDADGRYWLVTPVEKGTIDVEDAPFVAVEMTVQERGTPDQRIAFRTNLDHWVEADPGHAIRVETATGTDEPSPYVHVRDGLDALIGRSVFYDLVDMAEECRRGDGTVLVVRSCGCGFELGRID